MNKRIVLLILVALVFFAIEGYSQGCSQCRLVAEQGSELDEGSFGNGINTGILYLMAIPYIILFLLFRKRVVRLAKSLFNKA